MQRRTSERTAPVHPSAARKIGGSRSTPAGPALSLRYAAVLRVLQPAGYSAVLMVLQLAGYSRSAMGPVWRTTSASAQSTCVKSLHESRANAAKAKPKAPLPHVDCRVLS